MLNRLIPKIFYADLQDGLKLFVDTLGFDLLYCGETMAVVERDNAKATLVQDAEFAAKDRPELSIETDTINSVYDEIAAGHPEMLYPNARTVEKKPWGSLEFAVRDSTDVCVIFRQWD